MSLRKVCAWCEQEFGVKVDGNVSHGICPRHQEQQAEELQSMMRKANVPQDVIDQRLERIRTGTSDVPDMAETGIPSDAVKV